MIEIQNLTKKYGSFTALDSLDLTIEKGSVFGFVGQNGAGKSTTFSILATLLAPTSGQAYIQGISVSEKPKEIRRLIGYMPDFFGVYDQFKAEEYLHFYGASYGIPYTERAELIPKLLDLVNLTHKKESYVDLLSRGMKQRLCLARCLIHDPDILILDEPASGLDPRARVEMREILKELRVMGKTILISSHILPELAEMCDTIGVLHDGKLVAHGDVQSIQKELKSDRIFIVKVKDKREAALRFFEDQSHVYDLMVDEHEPDRISFHFNGDNHSQIQLLSAAVQAGIPILSFHDKETNLEDVFMEITKGVELE